MTKICHEKITLEIYEKNKNKKIYIYTLRDFLFYSFETSNGISHQETGQPKQVDNETPVVSQGQDSYVAPDGQQVSITWLADENGFQVQGSHIPTPPPIPPEIQRALEWNAAHPEEDDGGQRPPGRGESHSD